MNCAEQRPPRSPRRRRHSKRRKSANDAQAQYPIVGAFRAQHLVLSKRQIVIDLAALASLSMKLEVPMSWLAPARPRWAAIDRSPSTSVGERLRATYACTAYAAHDIQLVKSVGGRSPWWRNHGQFADGNDSCRSAARASRAGRRRPRIFRLVGRCLLFSKRFEGIERERAWPARLPARSCCNSRWIDWLATMVTRRKRAGRCAQKSEHGSRMTRHLAWRTPDYATAVNAAFASVRIRSTMERKPFERCGVRFFA